MSLCDKKCQIKLDKVNLEKRELEMMFNEYETAWRCCSTGGNMTDQGFCSYEWQDKQIRAWKNHLDMMQIGMMILGLFNAAMVLAGFIWMIAKLCTKFKHSKNKNPQKKPLLDDRGNKGTMPELGTGVWSTRAQPDSILKSGSILINNKSNSKIISENSANRELTNQKIIKKTHFAAIPEEPILFK